MPAQPFDPVMIGPIRLPNRLALAPVKTALGHTDGKVSARHIGYYRRRAEGGAGLIIVEPLYVDLLGKEHPRQLGAHAADVVDGLTSVVDAAHDAGACVFAHLNHAGRAATPKVIHAVPEAPSAVPCKTTGVTPRAMTRERIQELIRSYAEAAERVVRAGFDGVEVQLGLGYLPAQFLSEKTNLRGDEYGYAADGRWRFAAEIVTAIREVIGGELALTARISAEEEIPNGTGLHDAIELAQRLQGLGVDGLHVVTGSACDSPAWYYQHMAFPGRVNAELAAIIRSAVSIPVMVAGRLGDPERIRMVLEDAMADVVALGRPLIADPDLPRKMQEHREDEIMACGACLQGCLTRVKQGFAVGCLINPDVGREDQGSELVAVAGRRVVVVGGGPAGMQAALSARRRGFAVTLLEERSELGGQFSLAFVPPRKQEMQRPFRSLLAATARAGVDIRTGVRATAETIRALDPYHVILATGSRPTTPPIVGLEHPLTAAQVLSGSVEAGQRVLVVGGGSVGIETAEYLEQTGREVVVVELLAEVAQDMETVARRMTLRLISSGRMHIHTRTHLTRLVDGVAWVRREEDLEEISLGRFDSVLIAVGQQSYDPLSGALEAAGVPCSVVGDAARPGQIYEATHTAMAAVDAIA